MEPHQPTPEEIYPLALLIDELKVSIKLLSVYNIIIIIIVDFRQHSYV